MYYFIATDDKYAFELEKYEKLEEAQKTLKNSPWNYDYKAIIEGDIIFEEKNYN